MRPKATAQGEYATARATLVELRDWAVVNSSSGDGDDLYDDEGDHRGLWLTSRQYFARLDFAADDYTVAAKELRAFADAFEMAIEDDGPPQTLLGQLALFEAGLALWQGGELAAAAALFGQLAGTLVVGPPIFDPDDPSSYIGSLALAVTDRTARGQMTIVVGELPCPIRGLVYWVLAQHQEDDRLHDAFLQKASETSGRKFIWPKLKPPDLE